MDINSKIDRWSDRLNPIVVKELRQTVRSGALLTALLASAGVVMACLLVQLAQYGNSVSLDRPIGRELFVLLVQVLFAFCLIIIPLNAAHRLFRERDLHNYDLFFVSPLSAPQIIRGKLMSSGYEAFLFFVICAPFLFLTSLFRGVDVATILVCLMFGFTLVLAATQVAIFVGCLNLHRAVKSVLGIMAMGITVPTCIAIFFGVSTTVARRGAMHAAEMIVSGGGVALMLIVGSVIAVLHGLSIAMIANVSGGGGYVNVGENNEWYRGGAEF